MMDSVVQPLVRVWRRLRCLAKNCHGGHAPRCWDCEPRSRSLPLAGLLEKRKPSGSAPCEVLLFHPASFLVPLATGGSLKVGVFFVLFCFFCTEARWTFLGSIICLLLCPWVSTDFILGLLGLPKMAQPRLFWGPLRAWQG